MRRTAAVSFWIAGLVGCGDSVSNVAGSYTLAVTNGPNGCGFQSFMPGTTASGIPFTIRQDGAKATGVFGGGAGLFASLVLGSATLEGTVSGTHVSLMLRGTRELMQSQCKYTVNASMEANLLGDILVGTIVYTTSTNGVPDCAMLLGCQSSQQFNGARPPAPK